MSKSLQERLEDIEQSSREIARQAWERQRARKMGQTIPGVHPFRLGAKVLSSRYGEGQVVLSTPVQISVQYPKAGKTVDYPVSALSETHELTLLAAEPSRVSVSGPSATVKRPAASGTPLSAFIKEIRDEALSHLEPDEQESVFYEAIPERMAPVAPRPMALLPEVAQAYKQQRIEAFYSHQIKAREALLAGQHVILCTPTASGKTDAFNPTILEKLLEEPRATALYIYPLVALSSDQRGKLEALNHALSPHRRLAIGILNKTVLSEEKQATKRAANRILVTTPDTLHYVLLRNKYPNWCRFFQNLRFVVLDEAHVYKGVFGSNVANILRRLFIRCRSEGSPTEPQLIISSATIRNPEALATRLTGFPGSGFALIQESGAPQPARHHLALYADAADICYRLLDADTRTAEGTRPVRTIAFCRSIRRVKSLATALRKKLKQEGRYGLADQIDDYYSGRGDRERVFAKLVQEETRLAVTTTALMAGIDIGTLDVCVVEGFPGLVMDTRQMFGRVGRASEGASIFVGRRDNVFDQFFIEHPGLLFSGEPESAVVYPSNPYIQTAHLKCATHVGTQSWDKEGPLPGQFLRYFGQGIEETAGDFIRKSLVSVQTGHLVGHFVSPHDSPPLHDIRGGGERDYVLYDEPGKELERKREWYAFRDAHPRAILEINGSLYRAETLDQEMREVRCRAIEQTDMRTQGKSESTLVVDKEHGRKTNAAYDLVLGRVTVTDAITGYIEYRLVLERVCRNRKCGYVTRDTESTRCPRCNSTMRLRQNDEFVQAYDLPLVPPLSCSLITIAAWFELKPSIMDSYERVFWPRWVRKADSTGDVVRAEPSFDMALHAAEHALRKALPEVTICDPKDIDGLRHQELGQPSRLYVYDNFTEGLGLAEELFDNPKPVLTHALKLVENCGCFEDGGCPVCLSIYGCRSFNAGLSKLGARFLLSKLLGLDEAAVLSDLQDYVQANIPVSSTLQRPAADRS